MSTCAFFTAYLRRPKSIIPYLPRELTSSTMLFLAGCSEMDVHAQSAHWPSTNIPSSAARLGSDHVFVYGRMKTTVCSYCKHRRSVTIPFAIHLIQCPAKAALTHRTCKYCGESLNDYVTWKAHNAVCSNTLPQDSSSSSGESSWQ